MGFSLGMEGGGEDVGASRLNPKNILSNGRQGKGGEKGESEAKQSKLSSPCRPSPPSCRNLNPFFAPQLFPPLLFYAEAERTSSLPGFGFWQCRPRAVSVSVSRQAKILFPHSRVGRERGEEWKYFLRNSTYYGLEYKLLSTPHSILQGPPLPE